MDKRKHENRTFFSEYQRLKFQSNNIEREIGMLQSKSNIELDDEKKKATVLTNQQKYKTHISQRMTRLRHRVKIFRDHLTNNKQQDDYVEQLRQHMNDVEQLISEFKKQQQITFEKLLQEEETINDDVTMINKRLHTIINSTGHDVATDHKKKVASSAVMKNKNESSNLPPQIQQFRQYVNDYGRQGGWDDFDHSTFLRLRDKYKDRQKFLKITSDNLIGRTLDDVIHHDEWYQEYLRLYNDQKVAIIKWRKNKKKEAEEVLEIENRQAAELDEISEEMKEKERKDREMKKEKIQQWKKLKSEHEQRLAEEKKLQEEKMKKLKEKQQEQLAEARLEARLRFRERKMEREREKIEIQEQHEHMRNIKNQEAVRQIKRFQSRDKMELNRKLEEKRRKEEEEKLRKEKIVKSLKQNEEMGVDYDRSRVYQPTDAWLLRHQANDVTDTPRGSNSSTYVAHISHRAVPLWRKGV